MTGWIGLSAVVAELTAPETWPRREAASQRQELLAMLAERPQAPPRKRAAALALARYGRQTLEETPTLVNAAALALAPCERRVVHQVRPGAVSLVHATDLHTLPGQAPRLLRAPAIVEVNRPERGDALWGKTASLGAYELDGAIYLVGVEYPDGAIVARWRPRWGERDLDAGVDRDASMSSMIDDVDEHHAWACEAARFLVVFGLLLDAEGAPLRREDERAGKRRQREERPQSDRPEWVTRHIYLDERPASSGAPADSPRGSPAAPPADAREDVVAVRGHVKRQRYGEGREKSKWIYVESYEARRWVSPRPVRLVVSTHGESK